ncbi:MAG: thiamine-phosphate kinase [Chloroflexota bacterium]|nr:thiamine-phosphate kinase [Chloroflexota bacterium]
MIISELGEFGLIDLLASTIAPQIYKPEVLLGIGDDTAAWREQGGTLLATTDTMVQGVHFDSTSTWKELGWKAIAINLSDIAAMGGIPQYALISLCLPRDMEVEDITKTYEGIGEAASQFEVSIVGGNISSAPVISITLTIIGKARNDALLSRSSAKPGECIAVTGYLGSSSAGRIMLHRNLQLSVEETSYLRNSHLKPWPRIAEGHLLVDEGVRTCIDISDGLMSDLTHICNASGVRATIDVDRIPIHPTVKESFGLEATNLALGGGEDYELLFSANQRIITNIQQQSKYPITVIGDISDGPPGQITLLNVRNDTLKNAQGGWDHFIAERIDES